MLNETSGLDLIKAVTHIKGEKKAYLTVLLYFPVLSLLVQFQ